MDDTLSSEHTDHTDLEKQELNLRLTEALTANKALHDRLAELDVTMNIEAAELKREIETLSAEKEELLKENEFLLGDYTSKDHEIQQLLKELEIKKHMMEETSTYISTATERIKNLEKKWSGIESPSSIKTPFEMLEEGSIPEGKTAGADEPVLLELRREFEDAIGQKNQEIEELSRNVEKLREENQSLATEKAEFEKSRSAGTKQPVSLEHTLLDMEHSILELEQRISKASQIGVTEKEEILIKLDDAQREIFSLREYHRSLLEALRRTDEDAREVFSLSDYHKSILDALRNKEAELEMLRSEMQETIIIKDEVIGALEAQLDSEQTRLENEKSALETDIAELGASFQGMVTQLAEKDEQLESAKNRTEQIEAESSKKDCEVSELKGVIAQKEENTFASLQEFEDRLSAASARISELQSELAAEKALRESEISSALAERNSLLEDLRKTVQEKDESTLLSSREVEDRLSAASARIAELEAALETEKQLKESERASALTERELLLEDFRKTIKEKDESTLLSSREVEDRLSAASTRISELQSELAAEKALRESEISSALAERNSLLEDLRKTVQEKDESTLLSSREVEDRLSAAAARISELETALEAERQLKEAESASALTERELLLEDFRKTIKEKDETALNSSREIEERLSAASARIAELEAAREAEKQLREAEIAGIVSEKDFQIADLKNILAQKDDVSAVTLRDFRDKLNAASARITELEAGLEEERQLKSDAEDALRRKDMVLKELHDHFIAEADRLNAETLKLREDTARAMDELKRFRDGSASSAKPENPEAPGTLAAVVSDEIRRLAEQIRALKEEGIADRVKLEKDLGKSFSMISESAERLEQVISEGLPLAKKLEEISAVFTKENLPALYQGTASAPVTGEVKSHWKGVAATLAALLAVLVISGIYFREDIINGLRGKTPEVSSVASAPWASGVKQISSGDYDVTLTFLNQESVNVLGYSDILPQAHLRENNSALLVIKRSNGCIPESFIANPEENIIFVGSSGTPVALNRTAELSDLKKTVYRQRACGNKPGAIYLKHIISASRQSSIVGVDIRGLDKDTIVLR